MEADPEGTFQMGECPRCKKNDVTARLFWAWTCADCAELTFLENCSSCGKEGVWAYEKFPKTCCGCCTFVPMQRVCNQCGLPPPQTWTYRITKNTGRCMTCVNLNRRNRYKKKVEKKKQDEAAAAAANEGSQQEEPSAAIAPVADPADAEDPADADPAVAYPAEDEASDMEYRFDDDGESAWQPELSCCSDAQSLESLQSLQTAGEGQLEDPFEEFWESEDSEEEEGAESEESADDTEEDSHEGDRSPFIGSPVLKRARRI